MTAGLQRRQLVLSISTEIGLRVLKALQPLHVFPPVRKPSYTEQTREVRCQRHIEDDRCQEQIRQTQIAGDERGLALRLHRQVDHLARALDAVSYTHLRAHETPEHLVCRLLL